MIAPEGVSRMGIVPVREDDSTALIERDAYRGGHRRASVRLVWKPKGRPLAPRLLPMASGMARLIAAAALAAVPGCGAEERTEREPPGLPRTPAHVTVQIGVVDGPTELVFGQVASIVVDPGGRVYVADPLADVVRVFGSDGEYLQDVSRSGEGPGEYDRPRRLALGGMDELYVESSNGVAVFRSESDGGVRDRYHAMRNIWSTPPDTARRAMVDTAGWYYRPVLSLLSSGGVRAHVYGYGSTLADTMRIPVPTYDGMERLGTSFVMESENTGVLVPGLVSAPFEPRPSWAVTARGTVIGGDGREYVLWETSSGGDTVQVLRGPGGPRAIPASERDDSVAAMRARVEASGATVGNVINASRAVIVGEVPEVYPAFRNVFVGVGEYVWVELWPHESHSRHYDVFSRDGALIQSVDIPVPLEGTPPPFFGVDRIVGVVRDADTGVDVIVQLALEESLPSASRR